MSIAQPIRIGTRQSPLALAQAEAVRAALLASDPSLGPEDVVLAPMSTSGDRQADTPGFAKWGLKGAFTKELEDGLLAGSIDMAVHSMKDMPSILPDGLAIASLLPREDARDAFLSLRYPSLDALPQGATFGTSSVRRGAQLKLLRPDLTLVPFRGNVQTRLRKLEEQVADATLLAVAGLRRLGLEAHITAPFSLEQMLPAVAQGAIGIECRAGDDAIRGRLAAIHDRDTGICVDAERGFLAALDGSCSTPLAGHAVIEGSYVHLRVQVIAADGSAAESGEIRGPHADAAHLGRELGRYLRSHAAHLLG